MYPWPGQSALQTPGLGWAETCSDQPEAEAWEPGSGSGTASGGRETVASTEWQTVQVLNPATWFEP